MPANKGRKLPPELLTTDEVRALLAACSTSAPTGLRNRALLVTLYRAGLRLEEALTLTPAAVDVAGGVVRVGDHGAGHRRLAGIDAAALAIVEEWLAVRCSAPCRAGRSILPTCGSCCPGWP